MLLKYKVVSVGCEANLRFSWANEALVQVELSGSPASVGTSGYFRGRDESRKVVIEYKFGA